MQLPKLLQVTIIIAFISLIYFGFIRDVIISTDKKIIPVAVEICDRPVSEILGPVITGIKRIPLPLKRKYLFRASDISDDAIDCASYRKLNPQDIIYCPSANSEPGKKDLFLFSDNFPDSKIFKIVKWK